MRRLLVPILAIGLVAGCGREPETAPEAPVRDAAYATPPVISSVSVTGGGLTISGLAEAGERVRLIEMDGTAHGVTAGDDGAFSLTLPGAGPQDRLVAVNVQRAGRAVSADGWLFSPAAAPERAIMLRPGGASLPVGPAPLLAAVDVDGAGGVAHSRVTEPNEEVEVRIDGARVGAASADAAGRWSLALEAPQPAGPHRILAVSSTQVERTVDLTAVRPSTPLEASASDGVVRIAWALPGGGAQTTYLLLAPSS